MIKRISSREQKNTKRTLVLWCSCGTLIFLSNFSLRFLRLCVLLLFLSQSLFAQTLQDEERTTRILFVFDASASMLQKWDMNSGLKSDEAKEILTKIIDSLDNVPNVEVGLRVYGHQFTVPENNCEDTKLEAPFAVRNGAYIKARLAQIKFRGITPIAYSLMKAANDFPDTLGRNIIILLTDGDESCEGNPCEVVKELQRKGVILKPFVIGIGASLEVEQSLSCFGTFYNSPTPEMFHEIMYAIVNRAISKTTLQVNLNDALGHPSETDVNMTFYDHETGIPVYNFYHTLNDAGLPDTIPADPVFTYDIMVHTLPPIWKKNIVLTPKKHNVVDIDAAQGFLDIKMEGTGTYSGVTQKIKCLVMKEDDIETLNVQSFNTTQKYLVGKYDLELLTLPRIHLDDVEIAANKTSSITIPTPGTITLNKRSNGYGGIFVYEENVLTKIYEFENTQMKEVIALQPGKYKIVYRTKFAKTMHETNEQDFEIKSGESKSLNF